MKPSHLRDDGQLYMDFFPTWDPFPTLLLLPSLKGCHGKAGTLSFRSLEVPLAMRQGHPCHAWNFGDVGEV